MKKIMRYILTVALLIVIGCERDIIPTSSDEMEPEQSFEGETLAKGSGNQSMQAHELRLKHFAKTLAKAVAVPEVASYLKEEIGKKFDGDYDALWKTVKGKSFPGKGSLRGIIASNLKGLNGAIRSMADVEQVPKLQIALPIGFDEWDGVTPIKVAYTPLTIDDVDAEEIYAYDSSGEEYVLDAKTPPDFPMMVVGINERTDEAGNVTISLLPCEDCGGGGGGGGSGGGGGGSSDPVLKITQINLDRNAMDYEPWWMGDAELYFRVYDTEYANQGNVNEANVRWAMGAYSPEGGHVDYTLWNWNPFPSQSKPWRTINLNTGWPADGTLFVSGRHYTLRVMEYDPLFYDGGVNKWCEWISLASGAALIGAGSYTLGPITVPIAVIVGLSVYLFCNELVLNDDMVGEKNYFESIVSQANNDQGMEMVWTDNDFKIKVVAQ